MSVDAVSAILGQIEASPNVIRFRPPSPVLVFAMAEPERTFVRMVVYPDGSVTAPKRVAAERIDGDAWAWALGGLRSLRVCYPETGRWPFVMATNPLCSEPSEGGALDHRGVA